MKSGRTEEAITMLNQVMKETNALEAIDIDFIVGNLGLNYKFKASTDKPFMVYANDFDTNGTNDVFLAKYYKDNIVPIRGKECSTEQLPGLQSKFKTYNDFAYADINQIIGRNITDALKYEAHIFETILLKNDNGNLSVEPLPIEAQFSTVNGIIVHDFDADGLNDILLAGNKFDVEIETTPADASPGYLFSGQTDSHFEAVNPWESGFSVPENVKDIQLIKMKSNSNVGVLVAVNNGKL
ncbi:MAG: hypothetical protein O2887_04745 [Bacteroidetes bacterium]|nr:hypothetical protein [Bacteroidota bacterium]MDA1119792.1 hypothetical protein [Bacteroidota bacterium]